MANRSPNAEGEYQRMNEELLQEIPLSAPAEVRPEIAVTSPVAFVPTVSTSQFIVPALVGVPQSSGQSMDASIQAKWAKLPALRKPYPSAPPLANWGSQGFNVSTNVQDSQANIPQFFNFIESSAENVHAAIEVPVTRSDDSQRKEKSSPNSALDHPSRPGWVWSELGKRWYKTAETLEKEKSAQLSSFIEEESSTVSSSEESRIWKEVRSVVNQ